MSSSSLAAALLSSVVEEHHHSSAKVTVVGTGQVGMAAAFAMVTQVRQCTKHSRSVSSYYLISHSIWLHAYLEMLSGMICFIFSRFLGWNIQKQVAVENSKHFFWLRALYPNWHWSTWWRQNLEAKWWTFSMARRFFVLLRCKQAQVTRFHCQLTEFFVALSLSLSVQLNSYCSTIDNGNN